MSKKPPINQRYYEPIPGETHKAFMAFCLYRDMGGGRSLDAAYRLHSGRESGRHSRHWAEWSRRFHWVKRAQAYDRHIMRQRRKATEEARARRFAEYMAELGL